MSRHVRALFVARGGHTRALVVYWHGCKPVNQIHEKYDHMPFSFLPWRHYSNALFLCGVTLTLFVVILPVGEIIRHWAPRFCQLRKPEKSKLLLNSWILLNLSELRNIKLQGNFRHSMYKVTWILTVKYSAARHWQNTMWKEKLFSWKMIIITNTVFFLETSLCFHIMHPTWICLANISW